MKFFTAGLSPLASDGCPGQLSCAKPLGPVSPRACDTAVGPAALQAGGENELDGVEMPGSWAVVRDPVCYKTARHS